MSGAQRAVGQRPRVTFAPVVGYAIAGTYFGPFHTERASDCSSTDATMDLANAPFAGATIEVDGKRIQEHFATAGEHEEPQRLSWIRLQHLSIRGHE